MKQTFKYETHLHTQEASACASCPGAEYVKKYKEIGYQGIIVTDHFFNGNSAIPRDLPWEERVNRFCLGYENAKKAGDQEGFDVFFGWEHNFCEDEYLIYGLDKQWLVAHPEILEWSHKKLYEEVHLGGGCMVQAHPFRIREYIRQVNLHPECCDGVEVCNNGNTAEQDCLAYQYAETLGIKMTSGSDIHHAKDVSFDCKGMELDCKLETIKDYVDVILHDCRQEVITTDARSKRIDSITLPLDVYQYNYHGEVEQHFCGKNINTIKMMEKIKKSIKSTR